MKLVKKILSFIGLGILTVIGGLFLGYLLKEIVTFHIPFGEWKAVNLGQEKAIRFIGFNEYATLDFHYFVETDTGNVYDCRQTQCELVSPEKEGSIEYDLYFEECSPRFSMPSPPGRVRFSFVSSWCSLCSGQTSSVILTDGSLWNWERTGCCEFGCVIHMMCYALCGTAIATTLMVFLIISLSKKRRRYLPS